MSDHRRRIISLLQSACASRCEGKRLHTYVHVHAVLVAHANSFRDFSHLCVIDHNIEPRSHTLKYLIDTIYYVSFVIPPMLSTKWQPWWRQRGEPPANSFSASVDPARGISQCNFFFCLFVNLIFNAPQTWIHSDQHEPRLWSNSHSQASCSIFCTSQFCLRQDELRRWLVCNSRSPCLLDSHQHGIVLLHAIRSYKYAGEDCLSVMHTPNLLDMRR